MAQQNKLTAIPCHKIKTYEELDDFLQAKKKYMLKTLNAVITLNEMEDCEVGGFTDPTSADCYHLTSDLPDDLKKWPFVRWNESWIVFTSPSEDLLRAEEKKCHDIRQAKLREKLHAAALKPTKNLKG